MIRNLPIDSRPREKLLAKGARSLSDAELLAIFFRTGIKGMNAIELADHIVAQFGSLRRLFGCSKEEFCRHKGLGVAKYVQLQAILEMSNRYLSETLSKGDVMTNPNQTRMYLSNRLRDRDRETFLILYLDSQHQVILDEILFEGTINAASIYPREIVKRALFHNAAAIIVAHNHPSGIAEPSRADENVTSRIAESLSLVDIRLLDHFIVGESTVTSLAERGVI